MKGSLGRRKEEGLCLPWQAIGQGLWGVWFGVSLFLFFKGPILVFLRILASFRQQFDY